MNFFNKKILYIFFFTNCFFSYSQNPIGIPMGTWRTHYDYSNVKLITHFNNKLFGHLQKVFITMILKIIVSISYQILMV